MHWLALTIAVVMAPAMVTMAPVGVYNSPGEPDFRIGLVLPIHATNPNMKVPYDEATACGALNERFAIPTSLFVNMIEAINRRDDILPNVTLGYSIVDSCRLPNVALTRVAPWVEGREREAERGYSSTNDTAVLFAIGGYNSRVSQPLTQYLQLYDIPFIDVGATLSDLSDRRRYRLFARTSPSDVHQARALVESVKQLNHSCIHLIYSKGVYGEMGAEEIRKNLAQAGICVATDQLASTQITSTSSIEFRGIIDNMKQNSTARVIICFCEDATLQALIAELKADQSRSSKSADSERVRFSLVAGDYWSRDLDVTGYEDIANGAISVTLGSLSSTGAVEMDATQVMQRLSKAEADPWLVEFYETKFRCSFAPNASKPCDTASKKLTNVDIPLSYEFINVYTALSAGLGALQEALEKACREGDFTNEECRKNMPPADDFYQLIIGQQVDLAEFQRETFKFDANGEGPAVYTLNYYAWEATEYDEEGVVQSFYAYNTLGIWDNSADNATVYDDVVVKRARFWPDSNEEIVSQCNCQL